MTLGTMPIGEVARRAGLRPSAVRYYERLGLLPSPARTSGRRRYDDGVLLRLRVIQYARECGFTLAEVRQLFSGKPYSARLRRLATTKLAELDEALLRIKAMQTLLADALACECLTLEQCGRRLIMPSSARKGD